MDTEDTPEIKYPEYLKTPEHFFNSEKLISVGDGDLFHFETNLNLNIHPDLIKKVSVDEQLIECCLHSAFKIIAVDRLSENGPEHIKVLIRPSPHFGLNSGEIELKPIGMINFILAVDVCFSINFTESVSRWYQYIVYIVSENGTRNWHAQKPEVKDIATPTDLH